MASRLLVVASVAFAGLGLADADAAERRLDDGSGVKIYGGDDVHTAQNQLVSTEDEYANSSGRDLSRENIPHSLPTGAPAPRTTPAYRGRDIAGGRGPPFLPSSAVDPSTQP